MARNIFTGIVALLCVLCACVSLAIADYSGPGFVPGQSIAASFPPSFGTTPTNNLSVNVGNYPLNGMIPAGVLQVFSNALVVPPTYTSQPWPNTNWSSYCDNQNPVNGSTCVNFFSVALADGAQAGGYNQNGVIANTSPQFAFSGSQHGSDFGILNHDECNPNVWFKTGSVVPAGLVNCYLAQGGGEVVPAGGAFAYRVSPFAVPSTPWTVGFRVDLGSAIIGVDVGAAAAGNNQSSMPIYLRSTSATGVNNVATLSANPQGNFTSNAPFSLTGNAAWSIDNSSGLSTFTIATGSNAALPSSGGGLVVITDQNNGDTAIYLCSGAACILVSSLSGTFVAPTTTPAAGKSSVAFSAGYKIYNAVGSSQTYAVFLVKLNGS